MIQFPIKIDPQTGESYYVIRAINVVEDYVEVELNEAIIQLTRGFVLEKLAELIYSDSHKWHLIHDNNVVKYPGSWVAGDVVKIPNLLDVAVDTIETTRVYSVS